MNSTNATKNTRTDKQTTTNMFYGTLPLPQQFRNHRELVAGQSSHARQISAKVGNGFRITLYNKIKGPDTKVAFRETDSIRLSANTADALRQGAQLVKQSIEKLSGGNKEMRIVKVHQDKVGHVIGKGGETVKGIAKKVGEGTRIQYEEDKGGFIITGFKKASVDWAASLVQKQADAFKAPVKPAVSTEVDLADSLFSYKRYDGQQKNQAKWEVRKQMAQEINTETGEKIYQSVANVPWNKVDEKMAEMDKKKTEIHSLREKNKMIFQQEQQQKALAVQTTFPQEFEAKEVVVDEKWTMPSAMVFDPTVRAPPPPPPPAPAPVQQPHQEEEVELDGWEVDANENSFHNPSSSLMANVDPEKLAEEQRQQEMDEEYEEFIRLQHEDEYQRDMEETHYDEHDDDNWERF